LSELSSTVEKLKRHHKDLSTLANKLDEILDGGSYRVTAAARREATKVSQLIEQSKQLVAKSISDITP
jgi:hypothetical protein